MENLFGKITASLIDNDISFPPELVDIINTNISPPEKVTAADINIRVMYIVSDEINSYGGRFPSDEFKSLMNLIVDSPVLIGHRKDSLPIARNFYAEWVQKGETNWIKVYFYWLKNAKGAETLKNNIDGGIYKECSISFVFSLPECSICGDDIRRCGHRPFKEYQTTDGAKSAAFFNYREIDKVLETSIVYRGSVHDTSIANDLFFLPGEDPETEEKSDKTINRIWSTKQLNKSDQYMVRPAYESFRIFVEKTDNDLIVKNSESTNISRPKLFEYLDKLTWPGGKYSLDCRLIGYRGKERQKLTELSKYLDGRKSKVTRIELKVYDILSADSDTTGLNDLMVHTHNVSKEKLNETIENISTRHGVEITDCETNKKYLLNHKMSAFFKIISKEQVSGAFKYGLSGKICDADVECSTPVTSKKNLPIGCSIEIELHSIKFTDNKIELIFPKIIDSFNYGCAGENLELLAENISCLKQNTTYSVNRLQNGDALFAIKNGETKKHYIIKRFTVKRLSQQRRFVTDKVDSHQDQSGALIGRGQVLWSHDSDLPGSIRLSGFFDGIFILRPIVLHFKKRLLFYQLPDSIANGVNNVPG